MSTAAPVSLAAEGAALEFARDCGFIGPLVVMDGGRRVDVLHRAP